MTRKASKLNELRMPLRFARLLALDLSRQHRTVDCAGLQLTPADQTRTRPERRHRVISAAAYVTMLRALVPSIRERAAIRDEGRIEVVDLRTCAAVANLFAVVVQLGNLQPGQLAYGMITFRRIVNMHNVLSFLLQCVGAGAYREYGLQPDQARLRARKAC